ncbi:MAG: threonine/serine exporter family protein [Bariatricus sp.]|nr:threonine/serine exporter family protein [Bariatricus sp.]
MEQGNEKHSDVHLTKETAGKILHIFLNMGEKLMGCGAEVKRVEDTLIRLGNAYGAVKMNVFVITSSIVVTMELPGGERITQTRRILGVGGTDFTRMESLNQLSRRCCEHPMDPETFQYEMEHLKKAPGGLWMYAGSALAAGSHAVFFGGTLIDAVFAAMFGILICYLQKVLPKICPNNMIFNLTAAFLAGSGICAVGRMLPFLHTDKIMIGDIMLLIPGIAMTNSIRDILVGDTISGLMRLIESILWAGSLACGFMGAILLIGG